jgi:hypothetical protein
MAYLDENPAVMKLVDPIYVCISFPPAGIPVGFVAHLATIDPRSGVAAVPCANGMLSQHLFIVNSDEWAAHFIGYMQGAFPGLQGHRIRSTHIVAY